MRGFKLSENYFACNEEYLLYENYQEGFIQELEYAKIFAPNWPYGFGSGNGFEGGSCYFDPRNSLTMEESNA